MDFCLKIQGYDVTNAEYKKHIKGVFTVSPKAKHDKSMIRVLMNDFFIGSKLQHIMCSFSSCTYLNEFFFKCSAIWGLLEK